MSPKKKLLGVLFSTACLCFAQAPAPTLEQGFVNPPDTAKPRVWWHWMNGNITKAGIKADLEWMKRTGIGGFQNFDAALSTPQVVEKRLIYMTPEWKDAFKYAATLADELKLEMAIAGSPGWSESGGPWVTPAQGMKKYVWAEVVVEGGKPVGVLPKPPGVTGPFQNIAFRGRGFGGGAAAPATAQPQFYADGAVVAFRLPESEVGLKPKVSSSAGALDGAALTDGDVEKPVALAYAPQGQKAWIVYEFAAAQTVRAATLVLQAAGGRGRPGGEPPELEVSEDGTAFRTVSRFPLGGAASKTISFAPATGRFFRLRLTPPTPPQGGLTGPAPAPATEFRIAEFVLHGGARVHRFEEKAGFAMLPEFYSQASPAVAGADAVVKSSVTDLTGKLKADGTLDWTPPAGRWCILRIGYSLIGTTNHPASPEATGLEVDKLSKAHVKSYFDEYLNQYKATVGPLMGKRGLQYVITDSYEAGAANWTDDVLKEFAKRRGYDAHAWLPVLAGHVVESAEASDRFLWDFRVTLGDLMTENHYDQIGELLHARGMGRYTESHESGRAFLGDGMEAKRKADVPMSAMWTPRPGQQPERYDADIRESASVAHIYGQNLVAAESLTAGAGAWSFSPETLKPTADREMAMGLNRFVIHTSVHQPVDDKVPGLGLGPFGQWFTRHETWAEQAKPWISYLARSSYLLQQGRFVADVAFFYGEDTNVTALYAEAPPEVPAGYTFDYFNADALRTQLSVKDGRLATPSGMSYRVLALGPLAKNMSLPTLKKVRALVLAGAVVTGPKPAGSPSLSDDQAEYARIVAELWGGNKVATGSVAQALAGAKVEADFEYTKPQADSLVFYVHRKVADGDVYWLNNRMARKETIEASFRVTGKAPEFWYPESGRMAPAPYTTAGGRTRVTVKLDPIESVFVVFRKAAAAPSRAIAAPVETVLGAVDGDWKVDFQSGRGAPATATLKAGNWAENADSGIRYFAGAATYSRTVDAPAAWFQAGAPLWLDLGDVKNIAEVTVNGKPLGLLWKAPFRIDASTALKPGPNEIRIKVTNLWVNRLIGDTQPGVTTKYTYTTQPFYNAASPLLPSGLIGPVQVVRLAAAK